MGNGRPAPPRPRKARRGKFVLFAVLAAVLVGGAGAAAFLLPNFRSERTDLVTEKVKRGDVLLTVVEAGALEAANNHDIVCRVKTRARTNDIRIRWVIEDGSFVKTGQEVCRLESSWLEEELKEEKTELDVAENNWIAAEAALDIQLITNSSTIAAAETAITVADLELQRYQQGEYQKLLKDVLSREELAKSDLEQWRERVSWARLMVEKDFLSQTQLQSDRGRLRSAQLALEMTAKEKTALEFMKDKMDAELKGLLVQAKQTLEKAKIEAKANEDKLRKDLETKRSLYVQQKAKYEEIVGEIEKCTLYAPTDGMVVYYIPEQSRWGRGERQTAIAQGEPVNEGQTLMQIPDLSAMRVNTRVHEAMVSQVRGEEYKRTGFGEALQAGFLTLPNLQSRLFTTFAYPAIRDMPENSWLREMEGTKVYDGQRARVRINAFPGKLLDGHVKSVATVAQKQDWYSDVKVYGAMVDIHNEFEGLKPGMSAEVTIYTDKRADNVLTVPVQAVVRLPGRPSRFRCFVQTPEGIQQRDVVIGLTNDKLVEIKSGLEEGEDVITNPRVLEEATGPVDAQAQGGRGPGGEKGKGQQGGYKGQGGAGKQSGGNRQGGARKSGGNSQ